jgi:nitrogen regulatory protein PII
LLEDEHVDSVLLSIRKTTKGIEGQGIFWVSPVEQSGQL